MGDFAIFLVELLCLLLAIFLIGEVGKFIVNRLPKQIRAFVIEKLDLEELFEND